LTEEEIKKLGERVRKENHRRSIQNFIIIAVILVSAYIAYKSYVGEFIPIIHRTKTTKARIVKVYKYNWGKGVYKYIMTYEFEHDKKIYAGKYDLWSNVDEVGDSVWVEYAIRNPKLNEVK